MLVRFHKSFLYSSSHWRVAKLSSAETSSRENSYNRQGFELTMMMSRWTFLHLPSSTKPTAKKRDLKSSILKKISWIEISTSIIWCVFFLIWKENFSDAIFCLWIYDNGKFCVSLFWLSLHECIHFLKSVLEKKMRYGKVDSVLAVAKQEFTMYAGYSIWVSNWILSLRRKRSTKKRWEEKENMIAIEAKEEKKNRSEDNEIMDSSLIFYGTRKSNESCRVVIVLVW